MINVVAGIIRNEEGKFLITQRNLKKAQDCANLVKNTLRNSKK